MCEKLIVQVFFCKVRSTNRSDIESIWHIKTAAGWVVQENDVSLIKHDVVFLTNFGFFKEKKKLNSILSTKYKCHLPEWRQYERLYYIPFFLEKTVFFPFCMFQAIFKAVCELSIQICVVFCIWKRSLSRDPFQSSLFATHFIWKNDSAKLMNMKRHLSGVVWDLFGLYFLRIGK